MFANILVPTDYSESAARALDLAVKLARSSGGRVTVVRVVPLADLEGYMAIVPEGGAMISSMSTKIREAEEARLAKLVETDIPDDVHAGYRYVEGHPATMLIEEAGRGGHDLVVMGTHGRRGLARVVMGSVTEEVVRKSPVPVLTCH